MIYNVDLKETMESAFLEYGAHVAQERSIPDLRDGLKLGLRQGLYAQYTNGLTSDKKFQKAQKSVAAGMAQSYVHGDQALYNTLIRAAKPFAYRYPIEEAQGAFGSPVDPEDHSASRYVELRSSELANYFFAGLKKDAISEWYDNYDNTEKIPSVFPSIGFWNIVNGAMGIGVALATSIPQFNLREVNAALIQLIQNPSCSYESIYCAPDFATGCSIINREEVKQSLRQGFGKACRLRAALNYNASLNMIQATNLPYGVYTNIIIKQLAELTEINPSYGIERVVDHTKHTADIRIYLTKGVEPQQMIRRLYEDTSLEYHYGINMTMLDKGCVPKVFGWKDACLAYIEHIREAQRRILSFELEKANNRKETLEGLLIAIANIDEVVKIIKEADSVISARKSLMLRFEFTERQANAILDLKLQRLINIEAIKINKELEEIITEITRLSHLLNSPSDFDRILIDKLQEVADKFGDARRSKVINEVILEEKAEDINVLLLNNDSLYIIRQEDKVYTLPKDTITVQSFSITNLDNLIAVTNTGKVRSIKLNRMDFNTRYSFIDAFKLKDEEKIVAVFDSFRIKNLKGFFLFITKNGTVKKSFVEEIIPMGARANYGIKLNEGDSVVNCLLSHNNEDSILLFTNQGRYGLFSNKSISVLGKSAKGTRKLRLNQEEQIIRGILLQESLLFNYSGVFVLSQKGYGKIVELDNLIISENGTIMPLDNNDSVADAIMISGYSPQNIYAISDKIIKIPVKTIPILSVEEKGEKIIESKKTFYLA